MFTSASKYNLGTYTDQLLKTKLECNWQYSLPITKFKRSDYDDMIMLDYYLVTY